MKHVIIIALTAYRYIKVLHDFLITSHMSKLFSGWFDIVAHSHQWFHILTATGIYLQYNMAENALKEAIALRDSKYALNMYAYFRSTHSLGQLIFF